jgi:hypothetical protein
VVLNQLWPSGLGLFAGVGIILIGRAAGGILGIEAFQFHLPWVKRGAVEICEKSAASIGSAAIIGSGTRAAG